MSRNQGYEAVVDVDAEVCLDGPLIFGELADESLFQGDLGHTDLQEDLEFHSSSTSIGFLLVQLACLLLLQASRLMVVYQEIDLSN